MNRISRIHYCVIRFLFGRTQNGMLRMCGHTCHFCRPAAMQNACWGTSPNPASSAQAPYPAPRRKRRSLLIPLRLISPHNPLRWACARAPVWDKVSHRLNCGTDPAGPAPYRRCHWLCSTKHESRKKGHRAAEKTVHHGHWFSQIV